jgi:anaerobic selenocysteine-containing dehydrogenase
MLPDSATVAKAIEATEFVVVADCFLTDTARRAHVVLPVPTLLEDSDLLGAYGHHWIAESRPVVPMPPGVRHEVHIFQELARRSGSPATRRTRSTSASGTRSPTSPARGQPRVVAQARRRAQSGRRPAAVPARARC